MAKEKNTPAETPPSEETTEKKPKLKGFGKNIGKSVGGRISHLGEDFVSLKVNRQIYIILSIILFIAILFGGMVAKLITLIVALPLFISGVTGNPFLEKMFGAMPWNKVKASPKTVDEAL